MASTMSVSSSRGCIAKGGTITVTGGLFNTNGGIADFVTENTDEATKAAYPYVAK